jgi:O-antigen/teichoic acid export membrane protein
LNALSFGFNLWMARALGPHGYGVLVALLSLLSQLALPAATLTTVTSRFAALYAAAADRPRLRGLLLLLGRGAGLVALAAGAGVALAAPALAGFLHVEDPHAVALVGLGLAAAVLLPVGRGALQGLGRFGALAATMVLEGALKLALGVALVMAGAGPRGGVAGVLSGMLAATLLAALLLRDLLLPRGPATGRAGPPAGDLARFACLATCATGGLGSLLLLDILLVKHYFAAETAGLYAALTVAGKMLFWCSSAVPGVLYAAVAHPPRRPHQAAQAKATQRGHHDDAVILPLLAGVGALSGAGLAGFARWPDLVVGLLFGQSYGGVTGHLVLFGLAMTLYALSNVLVNYFLARAYAPVLTPLGAAVLIEVGLIGRFHTDLGQVVLAVLAANVVLLAGLVGLYLHARGRAARAGWVEALPAEAG